MNKFALPVIIALFAVIGLIVGWECFAQDSAPRESVPAGKALAPTPTATAPAVTTTAAPTDTTPNVPAAEATSADPLETEIRAVVADFVKAFDAGDAAKLTAHFAETGEIIDEDGNQYQGTDELKQLFGAFFLKFPSSKLMMDVESVRLVAPNVAIEEGSRLITTKEESDQALVRYSAVRTKVGERWVIASLREFSADPAPAPTDYLAGLDWLIGEWVNEGSDAVVKLRYAWSEDRNYILADLDIQKEGKVAMKCQQRIGWDPAQQKIRSWLFDSDGGFSEGIWTAGDNHWVVKSTATLPNGQTGSATITYTQSEPDRFEIKGTQRIVGDELEPDFEVKVVRKPPTAKQP
jgi:uncharacterized protein (TIGR02246 family)